MSKLADTGPPQRPTAQANRRYAVGAEIEPHGRVSLRLWAPRRTRVAVVMDGRATVLDRDGDGWFSAVVDGRAGSTYGFFLDDEERLYPDPASRFQPDGPHGLSQVVDPSSYVWRDADWPGISLEGQVFYELHVGTFTAEGTWAGAAHRLDRLRALGITTIQLMPIADFAGDFGWGYDGVNWFAPTRLYGRPDDLRAFVDAAHARGLGVILDAVYNHLGPDGNYLASFASEYFTDRYGNDWGQALNFDGPGAQATREFVLANVEHWIREYHLDGFRLDATQQIFDSSPDHLLAALARRARAAAGGRRLVITGENERQDARLVQPAASGGYGLDAVYNDDFHHSARVALTSVREAYYSDFRGTSQELLSAAKRGFLFQGQRYAWQGKRRGTAALDLAPHQFVHFLENHDQVANSAAGLRLCELSAPGELRALTALLLLGPATPLSVSRSGVGIDDAVCVFRASRRTARARRRARPARVPASIHTLRDDRRRQPPARSERTRDIRVVPTARRRQRARAAVLALARRPPPVAARRRDHRPPGARRPRRRDARRAWARVALLRAAPR